jgi:hypothetical protein
MIDLLLHERASLCAGRLSRAFGGMGAFDGFLLWHGGSPLREGSLVWQWRGSNGRANASGRRHCADPSQIDM